MAISKVSISNRALNFLKAKRMITSMTEESLEARQLNSHFDEALDFILEEHDWSFAIERKQLSLSNTSPTYRYTYKHALPTNPYCLRVLEAEDSNGNAIIDYKIEGRYLLSNSEYVYIRYISRVENLTQLSSLFRTALAYALASMVGLAITGSASAVQSMDNKYIYFLRRAITADSRQGTDDDVEDSDFDWINARFSGAGSQ